MTSPGRPLPIAAALLAFALGATSSAHAQTPATARADSVRLAPLQDSAVARDPRTAQRDLQRRSSALRLANIAAERLPALAAGAQAQYQSDVTHVGLPIALPPGATTPMPPHATYDASLTAREPLFDPTRAARRTVERSQLAESHAALDATLYPLRQQVNDAFFSAALLQAQEAELDATIARLHTQLAVASSRVRAGAALPGDSAAVMAALLRREQDRDRLDATRRASIAVLADLTGAAIGSDAALALPGDAADVERARAAAAADTLRARPEYAQFAATRALLASQVKQQASTTRPRLSAFTRGGYGRPGLDMLANRFEWYWLGGVQLQWAPFTWGSTERDQQALEVQRQVVATNEAAFRDALRRGEIAAAAQLDFLQRSLASDSSITALREETAREARLQFGEGVITAADYVDRETDLLDARLTRATHRVQLAQARANYLTMLGLEVH